MISSVKSELRASRKRASAPMRGRTFGHAVAALGMAATVLAPSFAAAGDGPKDFSELAERLVPAVVNISTTQEVQQPGGGQQVPQFPPGSPFEEFFRDFFDRRRGEQPDSTPAPRTTSLGSGFVVDASGYIVTNNHVIADAAEITIIFADDSTLEATLVGRDPKTDVALLKVEPEAPLTAVPWGDSDSAKVGNWVVAIGNPFGLGNSVTAGIISARARDINAGPFDDFLQTDASINRGNSGGPLFNMDGEVIGINTAIYSPSGGSVGIGFAIPANLAQNVVHQLREFGETRRGWLGVRIQTVTEDLAMSLGLDSTEGALVASVSDESPADAAGLMVGDVILKFDGKSVDSMRRLPRIVAETQIGSEVEVELWRDGQRVMVGVTVGQLDESQQPQVASATREPSEPVTEDIPELGLTLSRITGEIRQKFELGDDAKGVMVVHVEAESAAAEKGVRPGDLIVRGRATQEVTSPGDVSARIKEHRDQDKNTVLLLLDRDGDLQFVAVRLIDS